jgi:hypothetical protein
MEEGELSRRTLLTGWVEPDEAKPYLVTLMAKEQTREGRTEDIWTDASCAVFLHIAL